MMNRLIERRRKKKRKRTRKNAAEADTSKYCCPRILNNKNMSALGCGPSVFGTWQ